MASSREDRQQPFPTAPPSLSAGDHETQDYYAPRDTSRPLVNQAPYLTPYLGLRAKLSQIWINRWTILLVLVLVRTLIAIANLDDNLGSARIQALSACSGVEAAGSAMASMPHFMAQGVNELTATGVEKAVDALMAMLMLTVSGVEEMVIFGINMLTSTYVCLITFAVGGSLHAALDLANSMSEFLSKALGDIGNDLGGIASTFSEDLNKFVDTLNSIPFVDGSVPKLDISGDIEKLKTLQLPTGLSDSLQTLNQSIPTFQDVKNFTDSLIRIPFEKVKSLINESVSTYQFNRDIFPVPQREKLSFCTGDDGIDEFFDGLVNLEKLARKVFIAVIIILAIAVCAPMAWWEIKRWRRMQERAALLNQHALDPLDAVYIASRPHTSSFGIKLANKFRSVRQQTTVRWAIAYATSPPALFVLSLGIAGLFACLCQYILLQAIKKEVPELTNQVSAFAEKIVTSLNNASEQWALGTNKAILDTNNKINEDVFGWVNISTTAVNSTLNAFVDGMTKELTDYFGGTPLEAPVKEILNCLITVKIVGIQKALTWVQENAHIDFPLMPNDTFSLAAAASLTNSDSDDQFLATPGSKSKDDISAAVTKLTSAFESGIRTEAIISLCIIGLWFLVAFIGFGRLVYFMIRPGRLNPLNRQPFYTEKSNAGGELEDGTGSVKRESMAPTYEYAVTSNNGKSTRPEYTLDPRPFPNFQKNETVRDVGSHNPGVVEPTHLRSSSYGHVGGLTPIDEKSQDPFTDQHRR
jgi:hypothetical protein